MITYTQTKEKPEGAKDKRLWSKEGEEGLFIVGRIRTAAATECRRHLNEVLEDHRQCLRI